MNFLQWLVVWVLAVVTVTLLLDRFVPTKAAKLGLALERWRSGLRNAVVQIPGFSMPYLEGGASGGTKPVLVLVHGFGGDKDNFTRIARFLTPHYRVICPDLPGFGEASRDPQCTYTMAEQVDRLRHFLDQLNVQQAHLGGNSMGGFIVAQFAATYPQRVASVWLLNAAGTAAAHSSAVLQHYEATGHVPLLLRYEADFAVLMQATTHKAPFIPYSLRTVLARRGIADFALHTHIMAQLTQSPLLEAQYVALATPALIVWGAQDQILHPSGAHTLQALFTRSLCISMAGVGHLPMLEAPKRTALDYLDYQRSQTAPA